MKKIIFGIFPILFLTFGVFLCVIIFGKISFIERVGNIINDTFTYKIRYIGNMHSGDIVIVKIDDRTLDSLGKSDLGMVAFDKGVYADTIENIFTEYKASTLGIDVIFANHSVLGEQDEQKLSNVFQKYNKEIVIATTSTFNPYPLCMYSNVQHGIIDIPEQDVFRKFPRTSYVYDISSYCPRAEIYEGNKKPLSLFSKEILDAYIPNASPFQKEKIQKNIYIFDEQRSETAYIDYYSDGQKHEGSMGYESYSFVDIYKGRKQTPEGKTIDLKRKIVLIGEVGTLMHDSHFTPIGQNTKMPGVEINANIITTMLEGRNLRDVPFIIISIFFCLSFFLITWSVLSLKIWQALLVFIGVGCSIIGFGIWLFDVGYILNMFLGILGGTISFITAYVYRFRVTDKEKRHLKKHFSLYVSPDIVNEILNNPDSVLVEGEKRNMTLFFSDIVNFTGISEDTQAEILVKILNEYFSEMTKIIHLNKGTLDKYIGDSVMCFFNAPLRQDNHSFFACKTALQQQKKLRELNITWKQKKYPDIAIRIGIHTGEAIHGNIGSSDTRVNYTVIGDSVNLASRLEGVCKEYAISICVSQEVYELQKDAFYFRELDLIQVKGRQEPVRIYQLMADKDFSMSATHQEYIRRYQDALHLYQQNNFEKAQELFLKNTGDETSKIMGKRCQDMLEGKAELLQGVFQMRTK